MAASLIGKWLKATVTPGDKQVRGGLRSAQVEAQALESELSCAWGEAGMSALALGGVLDLKLDWKVGENFRKAGPGMKNMQEDDFL